MSLKENEVFEESKMEAEQEPDYILELLKMESKRSASNYPPNTLSYSDKWENF